MASFVVTNLADSLVGCIWVAEAGEAGLIERLYAFLVETEDSPFGAEKVLEEKIVLANRS